MVNSWQQAKRVKLHCDLHWLNRGILWQLRVAVEGTLKET